MLDSTKLDCQIRTMSKHLAPLDVPKIPAERRVWIGYQLKLRGTNFRALGREIGVSHQSVSAAAFGKPMFDVEAAIARVLGIKHRDLFPEHFDPSGARIPIARATGRKGSRAGTAVNVYPPQEA